MPPCEHQKIVVDYEHPHSTIAGVAGSDPRASRICSTAAADGPRPVRSFAISSIQEAPV